MTNPFVIMSLSVLYVGVINNILSKASSSLLVDAVTVAVSLPWIRCDIATSVVCRMRRIMCCSMGMIRMIIILIHLPLLSTIGWCSFCVI